MGCDAFGTAYASVNNVEAVTEAQSNKTLNIKKSEGSEASEGNNDEIIIDNIRYKRYNGVGKVGNTRLYTGREYDAELKLYYFRARYYSPDTGRFINRDPIDIADDVNLYAYVGNNGVMFVDPTGEAKALFIKILQDQLELHNKISDFVQEVTGIKALGLGVWNTGKFWYGYGTGNKDIMYSGILGLEKRKTEYYFMAGGYVIGKALHVGYKAYKTYKASSSIAILKNGYYEVNGFKFSEYYYEKLWESGRGGASLVAREILDNSPKILSDPMPGFNKYIGVGWEMIYNPTTKEVWHLLPIK